MPPPKQTGREAKVPSRRSLARSRTQGVHPAWLDRAECCHQNWGLKYLGEAFPSLFQITIDCSPNLPAGKELLHVLVCQLALAGSEMAPAPAYSRQYPDFPLPESAVSAESSPVASRFQYSHLPRA